MDKGQRFRAAGANFEKVDLPSQALIELLQNNSFVSVSPEVLATFLEPTAKAVRSAAFTLWTEN